MEVAILAIIFGSIFGIFYLFFSTRNKERLALIEKGADAKIFVSGRKSNSSIGRVFILNLALLAMGIGVGILLGAILNYSFGYSGPWANRPDHYIEEGVFYSASIFLSAGVALLVGFNLTRKLDDK